MPSKVKKFKAKRHKGTVKRVHMTGEGKTGKLVINRINDNHRNINKPRTRLLKAKRKTTLKGMYNKLKSVI